MEKNSLHNLIHFLFIWHIGKLGVMIFAVSFLHHMQNTGLKKIHKKITFHANFFLVICLYEMTFHAHEMNRVRKMDLYFSIGIEKGRLLNVYAYNWEIHITSIINITPIYECTFFSTYNVYVFLAIFKSTPTMVFIARIHNRNSYQTQNRTHFGSFAAAFLIKYSHNFTNLWIR